MTKLELRELRDMFSQLDLLKELKDNLLKSNHLAIVRDGNIIEISEGFELRCRALLESDINNLIDKIELDLAHYTGSYNNKLGDTL